MRKTYAYAFDPDDDFEERARAWAAKIGVKLKGVIVDRWIVVMGKPRPGPSRRVGALEEIIKGEMGIWEIMDHDEPIIVVTPDGTLAHPNVPDAWRYFAKCGGTVIGLDENHPDKRRKRMPKKVKMATAARLLKGREDGARKGWHQSGPAPYGYRRRYDRYRGNYDPAPRLAIDPDEAPVVRMMFVEYLRRKSMKRLIEHMHSKGLRTRRGAMWSRAGVSWILKNETYLGKVHFGKIRAKGQHPAIISPIIFKKVQKLIRKNNKRNGIAAKS